jgi:hypothetical protein
MAKRRCRGAGARVRVAAVAAADGRARGVGISLLVCAAHRPLNQSLGRIEVQFNRICAGVVRQKEHRGVRSRKEVHSRPGLVG